VTDPKPFVPVVAVLNMKGGVGKTTISAHLLRVLFQRKRAGTLLVDLDPQFNLTQALFTRDQYDQLKTQGKTVAAVMEPPSDVGLFNIRTTSMAPPAVDALRYGLFHFPTLTPKQQLDIVPGDFKLVKYSLMDDNRKLKAVRERFLTFIEAAKSSYRVICIDCNPSSSFLTLCALHACTHVLAPVRPDRYSILGLEILSEFVDHVPSISPKPQFVVVLNAIPRTPVGGGVGAIEAELRSHPVFGARTLANVIRESGYLKAKTDYTGFATDKGGPWSGTLRRELSAVADELATKLGIKP
jgi:chromosome partitioning protein